MANSTFKILTISDAQALQALCGIWQSVGSPEAASFDLSLIEGNIASVQAPAERLLTHDLLQPLIHSGQPVFRSVSLSTPGPGAMTVTLSREKVDVGFDTINVHLSDDTLQGRAAERLVSVRSAFRAFTPTPEMDRALGPELAEFHRRREESLLRLESLADQLIRQQAQARADLDLAVNREREEMRAEHDRMRIVLEEAYRDKHKDLEEREANLSAQLEALDNRSNTHARRKLREDLKKILAERSTKFALTAETTRKRRPIHVLFVVLLAASGIWTGAALWHLLGAEGQTMLAVVRAALGTAAFVGAMIYYIRWNDQWAQTHADEEFRLKQLELDVDRASWVVEMALEWMQARGSQIPESPLHDLTRGLFTRAEGLDGRAKHPTEDLASTLIRASNGLRITIPGVGELSLDRGGMKRFVEHADGPGQK